MNRHEERLVDTLDSLYWLNQKTPGIPKGDLKIRLSRLSRPLDWEQISLFRLRDEGQLKLYYRNGRIWVVSRHSAMDRPNWRPALYRWLEGIFKRVEQTISRYCA